MASSAASDVYKSQEIYLLRENLSRDGKFIFRENARFMLDGKNVLLLLASVTTGGTVRKGMRCVQYYKGNVAGVASIYSHVKEVDGIPVVSLFNTNDLPGYASHRPDECPLCKAGQPLDAMIDTYGYAAL